MAGRAGFLHRVSTALVKGNNCAWEKKNKVVEMATALERGETGRLFFRSFFTAFYGSPCHDKCSWVRHETTNTTSCLNRTHYKYVCSFQTTASQVLWHSKLKEKFLTLVAQHNEVSAFVHAYHFSQSGHRIWPTKCMHSKVRIHPWKAVCPYPHSSEQDGKTCCPLNDSHSLR